MHGLRLGTVNAHSIRDKAPALSDHVASKSIDILGITETWITTIETSTDLADMTPEGFSFFHNSRTRRGGAGVDLIDSSSSEAGQLSGILDSFDLHQYVNFPTHIHGHSLDLMICSQGCSVLSVSASDLISDHFYVVANLQIPSNHRRTIPQTIKYRKLQSINMEAFEADIQNSDLITYPKTNALVLQYNSVLHTLINLHAPFVTKNISIKSTNPWMTPAILASKRYRRYLEGVWRSNPTALNRLRLIRQTYLCNRQMSKTKSIHYSKIIAENSGD